jgi:hypothetical protein
MFLSYIALQTNFVIMGKIKQLINLFLKINLK